MQTQSHQFNLSSRFGSFGGSFVAETLMQPLFDLEHAYLQAKTDPQFQNELNHLLKDFVGRETPLYFAERISDLSQGRCKVYLKREDLAHTGAHKINNSLGQILLARRMNKKRIIAETGAGQHGVATAAVAARFGLECVIYMGQDDMQRQSPNVQRMRLLGAEVRAVTAGSRTLKDAVSEALRDWVTRAHDSHYILGSALGPHPYPSIVCDFQSVIGQEARSQILSKEGRLPDEVIACVGGGSNAIGIFSAFLEDKSVKLTGVEAGGRGPGPGENAIRFGSGSVGVFQGTETYLLQDEDGNVLPTHSVSAGLDYAAVGPQHSQLRHEGRVHYTSASDTEAVEGFHTLAKMEGILPALESSHAVAHALKILRQTDIKSLILINLSGRGDKDLQLIENFDRGAR